jgi:hypothetical protein
LAVSAPAAFRRFGPIILLGALFLVGRRLPVSPRGCPRAPVYGQKVIGLATEGVKMAGTNCSQIWLIAHNGMIIIVMTVVVLLSAFLGERIKVDKRVQKRQTLFLTCLNYLIFNLENKVPLYGYIRELVGQAVEGSKWPGRIMGNDSKGLLRRVKFTFGVIWAHRGSGGAAWPHDMNYKKSKSCQGLVASGFSASRPDNIGLGQILWGRRLGRFGARGFSKPRPDNIGLCQILWGRRLGRFGASGFSSSRPDNIRVGPKFRWLPWLGRFGASGFRRPGPII